MELRVSVGLLLAGFAGMALCLAACGSPANDQQAGSAESVDQKTAAQRKAYYEHPPGRPDLGRPLDAIEDRILSIDNPKERVREAIKARKLSIAEDDAYSLTPDQAADPEWQQIKAQLSKAEQADMNGTGGTDLAWHVDHEWLPQIKQLSTDAPQSVDDIWSREQFFETMAANLDSDHAAGDGFKHDTANMAAARRKLRDALTAKQAVEFPILRRAFMKLSAATMWSDDIEVTGTGRAITYTSAAFASNANIQQAEDTSQAALRKLRFRTASYAWCHGCRVWTYTLASAADTAIGD